MHVLIHIPRTSITQKDNYLKNKILHIPFYIIKHGMHTVGVITTAHFYVFQKELVYNLRGNCQNRHKPFGFQGDRLRARFREYLVCT